VSGRVVRDEILLERPEEFVPQVGSVEDELGLAIGSTRPQSVVQRLIGVTERYGGQELEPARRGTGETRHVLRGGIEVERLHRSELSLERKVAASDIESANGVRGALLEPCRGKVRREGVIDAHRQSPIVASATSQGNSTCIEPFV
jgi:hypothetical protein